MKVETWKAWRLGTYLLPQYKITPFLLPSMFLRLLTYTLLNTWNVESALQQPSTFVLLVPCRRQCGRFFEATFYIRDVFPCAVYGLLLTD